MAMYLRTACAIGLLLLALPVAAQAQFNDTTNKGTITITGYTGPGGSVTIPGLTSGLPVTRIGRTSFYDRTSLTDVTIPNNVTNIEAYAFGYCYKLTSATIGKSVANIGDFAFSDCWSLTNVCFQGNAPKCGVDVFFNDSATVYYLPGTTGWSATFAGRPALLWNPKAPSTNAIIAVRTNQHESSSSQRVASANQRPHR